MTAVIINCSVVVVLTSALPVLASTLGEYCFNHLRDGRGSYIQEVVLVSRFQFWYPYTISIAFVFALRLVSYVAHDGYLRSDHPNSMFF